MEGKKFRAGCECCLESWATRLFQIFQLLSRFDRTGPCPCRSLGCASDAQNNFAIGVSFYTFEAISYTVDVYRGRIPAERNLINFILFITFFSAFDCWPIIRGPKFPSSNPTPEALGLGAAANRRELFPPWSF